MSRHRNIKNISIDDELSEDVYGRSLDEYDDYGVSPATEAQFMYRRDRDHTLSSFIGEDQRIEEEEGEDADDSNLHLDDLDCYQRPQLDPISAAKLQSCMEQLQDILGDSCHESTAVQAVLASNFDFEQALDQLLHKGSKKQAVATGNAPAVKSQSEKLKSEKHLEPNPFKNKTPSPRPVRASPNAADKLINDTKSSSGASTPKNASRCQSLNTSREELEVDFVQTPRTQKAQKREVIDIEGELEKRQDGKGLLNLVVIGHVDAGKSTMMGHILFNLGNVSKKIMHKNETESKKSGKGSFAFAWVLDETEEERTRGITMDVAMTLFETKSKIITLMDAPGHRDFIPNMIQGTAQADVAVLVVDSRPGEFEAGFEAGGQTREHALLARSLGVGQMVVAVNKMDSVEWSKERFDDIVIKLKTFLTKQAGFKENDVTYIPCSGLSGENLTSKATEPALIKWYSSNCLVDQIDLFKSPPRPIDKPFRLCVSDVYKGQGSGFVIAGKVESGSVQNNDRIILMPANEGGSIKGLQLREEPVKFAAAGDHVVATITGVDMAHVTIGSILSEVERPIKNTCLIRARVVVFAIQVPITKGFMVVFHTQNLTEPATVNKLVSILNKATGEVAQNRPRCLTKQMNAVIEIKFSRPVSLELYKDNKMLGRFMLRYSGKTIAAGVVTEIK